MGFLVTRFMYPNVNDEIIARQRRIPSHRLTGALVTFNRWPNLERLADQGRVAKARFADRAGRKKRGRPGKALP